MQECFERQISIEAVRDFYNCQLQYHDINPNNQFHSRFNFLNLLKHLLEEAFFYFAGNQE